MKKLLLPIVILIGWATIIMGQPTFSLQVFTDDYENITNGTSLNNGITWDDPQYTIPFGFDFIFYEAKVNEIFINGYGLGGLLSTDTSGYSPISFLIPYAADIIDRGYDPTADTLTPTSESNIAYVIEGIAGQRILKVEWNNAGFFNELFSNGISNDYVNFQMWIYEEDSSIEFRYGPKSISDPFLVFNEFPGTSVGFIREYDFFRDTFTYAYLLVGLPTQPTPVLISSPDTWYGLSGIIPDGTVYRFERTTVSTIDDSPVESAVRIFPNPGKELTVVSDSDDLIIKSVAIRDALGRRLLHVDNTTEVIEAANGLPSGTYLIEVRTDKGTSNHKWIKRR